MTRTLKLSFIGMAFGIWLFLAVSQFWSLGMPFGLPSLPIANDYGTAFLGSGGMGCLILLLGILCFSVEDNKEYEQK
ncbi:MAG: hypothetical protein LBM00_10730 [Deltaproteobacteria bacterium]|jgi:hypothetical protein|nr:hypothetical protein [Deltaproteobacteria bacterium]